MKLEKIITSDPIDAVAGRVTSRGTHWNPRKTFSGPNSDLPLPIRAANYSEKNNSAWADLTGRKVGRLTVLGIYAIAAVGKNKKQAWVVRCQCGRYETRTARAIRNPENKEDYCEMCYHLRCVKKSEEFRRTGRWNNEGERR